MQTFTINSHDGKPIFCTLWDDVKEPKAVLQISHGMTEYAPRYQKFAEVMNAHGYIVFADDHRAHGRTEKFENLGKHKGDIFDLTLKDLTFFHNWLDQKYHLPQVFLGHSYGSFLGQAFAQCGTDVKAIALLGTAKMGVALPAFAQIVMAPLELVAKDWRPKFVNKGSDLLFDGKYKGEKGPSLWLSRNPESRQGFIDDPYCGIDTSINFNYSMMKHLKTLYSKKALSKLNKSTPIAVCSGTADPIGGNKSSKAKALFKAYQKVGIPSELHLYEGARHELLGELCRVEVFNDLLAFFDKSLGK